MMLFSTHPPLQDRIRRVDPGFQPEELDRLAAKIRREHEHAREKALRDREKVDEAPGGFFDAGQIIDQIGNPDWDRMLMAAAIAASIPDNLSRAAHSTEWAPEVLFYTLMDADAEIREQQLLVVARKMGADSELQVRSLIQSAGVAPPEQRLPLLEVAFPALKRRPPDFVTRVLDTVKSLVEADGRVDVFEYLLARVIRMYLWESHNPNQVKTSGRKTLKAMEQEALQVLAVLAQHGHSGEESAAAAYRAGADELGLNAGDRLPRRIDWVDALDEALPRLDRLKPGEKEKLVGAMLGVILHDDQMVPSELELLRVICDLIHVPLPLLTAPRRTSPQS